MNNIVAEIVNLSVNFNTETETVQAIQNISFQLERGKTLSLVGESGSGKSVSALSLMGLLPSPPAQVVSGSILFHLNEKETIDLVKLNAKDFEQIRGKRIGIIFQEPMTSLNPLMRCGKQVAETIQLHENISLDEAMKKTLALFEEVKLPNPQEMLNRYPHELSGGQKQRVMIAIAICCNPDLLIADEPTTALDVTIQKTILDLLKELQLKKNMAILFITHDLNLVKEISDTVMVMYKSKCVEYNTTDEIFNHPTEKYTQGLLACRPSSTERVNYLKTVQDLINDIEGQSSVISQTQFEERIDRLQSKSSILSIQNLHVWYPTKTNFFGKTTQWFEAVNGVNLEIKEGETLGLVGESGCGKTTIGRAIVKLTAITSGEIIYKGKSIADFTSSELATYRREVQIIFQDPYSSLNPRIPVGDAIREPMDVHGILHNNQRKERVIELLNKVDLPPSNYARYPHEFSGGQRQRICIARALALESKLIICDESVSALDVSVQAQVLNLLVSLREEFNLSYLFISHDLGVVKHISDHVAVMKKGIIIEENNAEQLYNFPEQHYTQELIASSLY